MIYYLAGDDDIELKKGVRIDKVTIHTSLGYVYRDLGDNENAIKHLDIALPDALKTSSTGLIFNFYIILMIIYLLVFVYYMSTSTITNLIYNTFIIASFKIV